MRSLRKYIYTIMNIIVIGIVIICIFKLFKYYMSQYESFIDNKNSNVIYFIITASINDIEDITRREQYINGITSVLNYTTYLSNCKVIVVENNGLRPTYLDSMGVDVYYTDNNSLGLEKGTTELLDINACINKYNIRDDDFVVKMTGRYKLDLNSPFMNEISRLNTDTECIIRYGSFYEPDNNKNDCITGLIGIRCKYIKMIKSSPIIEHAWAATSQLIEPSKVIVLNPLGIYICPGSNEYFLV